MYYQRLPSVILMIGILSFSSFAQQKKVIVTGKVVDSVTSAAIPNAKIILSGLTVISISQPIDSNAIRNLKYDTVYSKTDGTFSDTLVVVQTTNLLVYGVLKQGYAITYSFTLILLGSVDLGVIKVGKPADLIKDTITVSGTVVDSASGAAIAGVQMIMTGLGSFDTTGNTAVTDVQGKITKQVIVGNSAADRVLTYLVSKNGYFPAFGQQAISGKTLDIGTIKLKSNGQGIIVSNKVISKPDALQTVALYSVRGQLLYSGDLKSIDKKLLRNGIAVAAFKTPYGLAGSRKIAVFP